MSRVLWSSLLAMSFLLGFGLVTVLPVQAAVTIKAPKKLKKEAKNINKATFDELVDLKYMNPSRARTFIEGQPWKSIDDVFTRKGFFDAGDLKDIKKAFEEGYLYLK